MARGYSERPEGLDADRYWYEVRQVTGMRVFPWERFYWSAGSGLLGRASGLASTQERAVRKAEKAVARIYNEDAAERIAQATTIRWSSD